MDFKKIWQLVAGTTLEDTHEIPVSEGVLPGETKRYNIAALKAHIWAFVQLQIADFTKGDTGATGATGPQGIAGPIGPVGATGPQGLIGPAGNAGMQGPQGIQGPIGNTGAPGAKGDTGIQGIQGPIGPDGMQGPAGEIIVAGDAANILHGLVNPTNDIGVDDDFYINTEERTIFGPKTAGVWNANGVIMTGPTGPQGPAGPVGPIGPIGEGGNDGAPGEPGATGPQGLTGPQGPGGPVGAVGPIGPQGPEGPASTVAGPVGPAGAVGPQGPASTVAGPVGPAGPQGPEGPASTVAGPAGPAGPEGPAGPVGPEGPASTVAGPVGPAGPQGPEGPAGAAIDDITAAANKVYSSSKVEAKFLDQTGSKLSATAAGINAYTVTITPAITALLSTHRFFIKFANANTGPSTLSLNGIAAAPIVKNGSAALVSGDILANQIFVIAYDGANFQIVGSVGGGGGGVTINDTTPSGSSTYSSNKVEAKFLPITAIPAVATGEKAITVTPSGLQKTYDLIDPYIGTTTQAQLDAAVFTNNLTTLPGYAGEERLQGTNYIYKCISDNTWRRWINPDLLVVDFVLGTVNDTAGIKTSAQMIALYPAAISPQIVYGANGKYELTSGSGWFYFANSIAV